jgi:hypothetical protein
MGHYGSPPLHLGYDKSSEASTEGASLYDLKLSPNALPRINTVKRQGIPQHSTRTLHINENGPDTSGLLYSRPGCDYAAQRNSQSRINARVGSNKNSVGTVASTQAHPFFSAHGPWRPSLLISPAQLAPDSMYSKKACSWNVPVSRKLQTPNSFDASPGGMPDASATFTIPLTLSHKPCLGQKKAFPWCPGRTNELHQFCPRNH